MTFECGLPIGPLHLDGRFRKHAFSRLRRGLPVPVEELLATAPPSAEEARATLTLMARRGMAEVRDDVLVAIDGLSVVPTRHRLRSQGVELFTWCAADAVGIPAALGEDAEVLTSCPSCGALLHITVVNGKPRSDLAAVLWLPLQECSHVMTEFCPDVNLFCDEAHLQGWLQEEGAGVRGSVLSIEETAALGEKWWSHLTSTG
ncbi:MAG: organomercurial lyase [Candidatus Rokuibacteriota bacterium]